MFVDESSQEVPDSASTKQIVWLDKIKLASIEKDSKV